VLSNVLIFVVILSFPAKTLKAHNIRIHIIHRMWYKYISDLKKKSGQIIVCFLFLTK